MEKTITRSRKLDTVGSIISFSCALHCLAFPILISTGSLMMVSSADYELTETFIIIPSILIAAWSVSRSFKIHKKWLPLALLVLSLILLSFGKFMHLENLEVVFCSTGAILLATAHLTNRRLLKKNCLLSCTAE